MSLPYANAEDASPSSHLTSSFDVTPPVFGFARALLHEGEYYRAIGEFQRFLFAHPEHPLASEAQLHIATAFFCGERWLQAFELFRRIAQATPDTPMGQRAALWMAETRARGADHPTALRLYQEVIARFPGTPTAQRAAYMLGWSLLRQGHWSEAHAAFADVGAESPYHPSAQRIAAALDPPPALPRRSPALARALSLVLPGAGQVYTGKPVDGIIGLGVHGALIAGTTEAVLAGLEGAAGLGAFFAWGFYRTQLSNAAASAREFNAQAVERFIEQLASQGRTFITMEDMSIHCPP